MCHSSVLLAWELYSFMRMLSLGPSVFPVIFYCLEHYGVHVPVECTMGLSCQVYLGFSLLIKRNYL